MTDETKPAISLARLTARDMQTILQSQSAGAGERGMNNLSLLDRCVDGGLDAVPLPLLPAYLKAMDAAIEELFSPKS